MVGRALTPKKAEKEKSEEPEPADVAMKKPMPDDAKPVETTLLAQSVDLEKTGQPARPDVLEEMSRIARARMIQPESLPDLIKEITALPEPRPLENRVPLWHHWATITAIIALLALFWVARKFNGQI